MYLAMRHACMRVTLAWPMPELHASVKFSLQLSLKKTENAKCSLSGKLKKTEKTPNTKCSLSGKLKKGPIAFSCCCVQSTIGASHRYALHCYITVVQ